MPKAHPSQRYLFPISISATEKRGLGAGGGGRQRVRAKMSLFSRSRPLGPPPLSPCSSERKEEGAGDRERV